MLRHPLSLKGVYSFIIYVSFYSEMQKAVPACTPASLKIAQTASARFYNYATNQPTSGNQTRHPNKNTRDYLIEQPTWYQVQIVTYILIELNKFSTHQ